MSRTKFYDEYDVDFRIATPGAAICCEAARSGPRLLHPAAPDPETLRAEFKPPLHQEARTKPIRRRANEAGTSPWVGQSLRGDWDINRIGLIWSDGDRCVSVDRRIHDASVDVLTKYDHFATTMAAIRA